MEKRADDKFDMSSWCGTACCAAGVAALDPKFRERGFRKRYMVDPEGTRHPYINSNDLHEVLGITDRQLHAIVYDTEASKAKIVRKINKLADKVEASIK